MAGGSLSRFGRALGTSRNKAYPQGIAIRGYFESPLSQDPWIESALDVHDRAGASIPGYGWIFGVGDGTSNVGLGILTPSIDGGKHNSRCRLTEGSAGRPADWGLRDETWHAMVGLERYGGASRFGGGHPGVGPPLYRTPPRRPGGARRRTGTRPPPPATRPRGRPPPPTPPAKTAART